MLDDWDKLSALADCREYIAVKATFLKTSIVAIVTIIEIVSPTIRLTKVAPHWSLFVIIFTGLG